jgi:hypothetical protein
MLPAGYAAAYKKQMLQPSTATSVFYFFYCKDNTDTCDKSSAERARF